MYEITFITKEEKDDKIVKDLLASLDGKIMSVTPLGEKQFAYKIKNENRGFYTTFTFTLDTEKLPELTKKLSLKDEVIRFLVITAKNNPESMPKEAKVSEKPKTNVIAETPKAETDVIIEEPAKDIKPDKVVIEKPVKKEVKKPVSKPVEKPKPSPKVTEIEKAEEMEEDRLKALDKKLDELLKE